MELSFSETLICGVRQETVIDPLSFFLNIYFICFNTVRLSDSKVVFVLLFCILYTLPHDKTRLLSQVLISRRVRCPLLLFDDPSLRSYGFCCLTSGFSRTYPLQP